MSISNDATSIFPVTHSTPSAAALMSDLRSNYNIGTPIECKLLSHGLNDTYLVRTAEDRYILRVYRTRWRSVSDIGYELDALVHLDHKGVPVAAPISRKDGTFWRELNTPEGPRHAVLFRYATGQELSQDRGQNYLYGRAVAEVHALTDDFASQHRRFHLDLQHLLDQPLVAIEPFLVHRPDDWSYLQRIAERLREQITSLPLDRLDHGFCHGDFHGGNAHIDDRETITFFDFDCGGPGWRAYDIAVFRWGPWGRENAAWEAFLKGYTERRPLSDLDLAAVPLFVAARHIWLLGLHTGNSQDWGCGWLNDAYFDDGGAGGFKFLREWEAEHLNGEETDI